MIASILALVLLAASRAAPVVQEGPSVTSPEGRAGNAALIRTWDRPRRASLAPAGPGAAAGAPLTFVSCNADPEGDMPREVAFTPDGTTAVIANSATGTLTFLDVATRTITHTVAVGEHPVHVAVTPDGRYALVPNVFSDTVSVVEVATHSVAAHVPVSGDQPFRVAVTSDSAFAVAGVINDAITSALSVIDLGTLEEVRSIATPGQGVIGFFFTPESGISGEIFTQFALAPGTATVILPDAGGDRAMLYDLTSGDELAALPVSDFPVAVDASLDGTLAVVSHEGTTRRITEIDLAGRTLGDVWTVGSDLTGQVIRITPDNSHAIAAILNAVIFVNLSTGATASTLNTGSVGDIEISFDGQYAFVSNFNARIIDLATRTIVDTITFAPCAEAAASPVELRAVALNNRFREDVNVYDIDGAAGFAEGRALSGEPPEGDATRTLALSPDGTTLVAANNTSRNVSIVNVASGAVAGYADAGDRCLGVAVSSDGTTAVVCNGDDDTVSIIDLVAGARVANLPVASRPGEVRISPDGQTAYVTTVAGTDRLHFIDLDGAESTVTGSLVTGQMGSIIYTYNVLSGLEVSPDGSIAALCISFEDRLLLVDAAAQDELVSVTVGDFPIRAAFSSGGDRAFVVNSFSNNLHIVDIDGPFSSVCCVVGGIEFPLTVNPDAAGDFVYVGSFSSTAPSIRVVDTALESVVATVPLGSAPRAAHLSDASSTLYVATTGDGNSPPELVRIAAAGPASAAIDALPLTSAPSDMVFSESRNVAAVAQPIPDGVDLVRFTAAGDLDRDGAVGITDLLILLGAWGPCPPPSEPCPADLDGDGAVGITDLLILLSGWG